MSLILDALKKLDRQKTPRWTRPANIAAEILKPHSPRPGKRTSIYLVAVLLAVVASAAITYAVILGFGFLSQSSPPSPVKFPLPKQKVAAVPKADPSMNFPPSAPAKTTAPSPKFASVQEAGPPPKPSKPAPPKAPAPSQRVAPSPESGTPQKPSAPTPSKGVAPSQQMAPAPALVPVPASPSPKPVRTVRDEASRLSPKIQTQVESKIPITPPEEKKARPAIIPEKAGFAPRYTEKPPEPTADGPAATPPPLKITGILWDEEPAKRRAVINGTFTTEGSTIEGVKVVEIYPTRVRFLHAGRFFEVSIF